MPEPVVARKDQKNANGEGGGIDRYSFVGNPFRDDSNSLYYVDDVVLSTDTAVRRAPVAALRRWPEMEAAWSAIYSDWREDARFPLIVAMIGLARGELSEADSWLRMPAELSPRSASHGATQPSPDGDLHVALHNRLAAEEYFYVLLWQRRWALAAEYATRMATRLEELKLTAPEWIERSGDAWFFAGDYRAALGRYEDSLGKNPGSTQAYLRLSDAWFRLGDIDKERHYREAIYGVLK